jgi:hypothetical protein
VTIVYLRRGRTHPFPELVDPFIVWCGECEQYAAKVWLCPVCLDKAQRDRRFAGRAKRRYEDHMNGSSD